jgi:hypothetical protein
MHFFKKAAKLPARELKNVALLCVAAALLVGAALLLSGEMPASLRALLGMSNAATPYGVLQGIPEYNAPTPYKGGYPSPSSCNYGSADCGVPYVKTAALSIYPEGSLQGQTVLIDHNGATTSVVGSTPTLFTPGPVRIEWSCQPSQAAARTCSYQYECGDWWRDATCTQYYDCSTNNTYANTSIGGNFSTGGDMIGTTTVTFPTGPTTQLYTLQCKNNSTGQVWSASIPVKITSATLSLTADPDEIVSGGTSQLTWATTLVVENSCTIVDSKGQVGAKGLGTDSSGNNNVWTLNYISGVDQLSQSPTRDFAQLNSDYHYSGYTEATIQAGGLAANGGYGAAASWQLTSGKWYWEYTLLSGVQSGYPVLGVWADATSGFATRAQPGHNDDDGIGYSSSSASSNFYRGGRALPFSGPQSAVGDVVSIAYDADTGKVFYARNGAWMNSGNPVTGTGAIATVKNGWPGLASYYGKTYVNFGQGGAPSLVTSDASSFDRPISRANNVYPQITNTQSKFGQTSANVAGSGAFAVPSASDLNFTGDFTIDMWVRPASSGNGQVVLSKGYSGGYTSYMIYTSGGNYLFYGSTNGGSWNIANGVSMGSIALNTWTHLAVSRSGTNIYLYKNGVLQNTIAGAGAAVWSTTQPLWIGQYGGNNGYFNGFVDEVRISNNARWTGSPFTPPTSEYASDANTLALFHMNEDRDAFYASSADGYFAYTPPTGYKALSATNLPEPAITRPTDYFNVFTYLGNSGTKTITTTFSPDLIWIKNRTAAYWNTISDSVRGANSDLFSNSTSAAVPNDSNGWVTAFSSSGFSAGGMCQATPPQTNLVGNNYVAWAWKKSQIAGIDVVSYTGDGATLRSVSHSLGSAPSLIIVKRSDQAGDWFVSSSALTTPASYIKFNSTAAESIVESPFSFDLLPTMTAATTNGVTLSASTAYSGGTAAWMAGDKNNGTYWEAINNTSGYPNSGNPQWLRVDFGASDTKTVGAYTIRNYASAAYAPFTFTFQGSNDSTSCTGAGTAWTTLDTREWAQWRSYNSGQYQTFTVPEANRGAYRCYRVYITQTSNYEPIIVEFNLWPDSSLPTASVFSVQNNSTNSLNVAGGEYVAYLFTNKEGFQKTGTYTGNGSTNGTFIYTGFKPKWVYVKRLDAADGTGSNIVDSTRSTNNPASNWLHGNLGQPEGSGTGVVDLLTNGFKIRYNGPDLNVSQATYLYVAFAETPFKSAYTGNSYNIPYSLRFDRNNSEYLSKMFDKSPSSLKKMTFSFWVKRGQIENTRAPIISGSSNEYIAFQNDRLMVRFGSSYEIQSAALFRDTAKWYHVVVSVDTTPPDGGVARVRMYVDGKEITTFNSASFPAQNINALSWNVQGQTGYIGRDMNDGGNLFDGYLADFNFIDGQALSPTWFGAYDGNGYWKAKAYTDVYGNNGFRLDFADMTRLGADVSGKDNNWFANFKSALDQTIDTPTNSFTTLSDMHYASPNYSSTARGGGLVSQSNHGPAANWQLTSGKWYWEFIAGGINGGYPVLGIFSDPSSGWSYRAYPGHSNDSGFGYSSAGQVYSHDSLVTKNVFSSFINNDIIGVAYDADSGKVYYSRNGVWQNGFSTSTNILPTMAAGTNGSLTISATNEYSTSYGWRVGDRLGDGYYWYTYGHVPSAGSPDWLRFDFGSGNQKTLVSYSIQNYYNGLGYDPINFTFQGSNDAASCSGAGTTWTTLDTETDVIWSRTREVKFFDIAPANQAPYRCYRLYVTGAGTPQAPTNYLIIDEMGLYTEKPHPDIEKGYAGVVKNGTPGLSSPYGRTYVNFGSGGAPGVTFEDASSYGKKIVESGITMATTSQSVFGGASFFTDNNTSGALVSPLTNPSGYDPAGDFTIDLWVRPTQTGFNGGILSRDAGGYSPYLIYQNSSNNIVYYSGSANGTWDISDGGSTRRICTSVTANTWYHVAVVRAGNTYSLYCNGTRTNTWTNALKPWRAPYPLVVGRQQDATNYFRGYIDEVRMSDTARWTGASFSVPTSEYASDGNTLLLLHMEPNRAAYYRSGAGGYFAYAPPVGYKAVSTANLPDPAARKPSSYFEAKTYTGNAGDPSFDGVNKGTYISLSNNNFDFSSGSNGWGGTQVYGTKTFSSGKWYAEFKMLGNYPLMIGIGDGQTKQTSAFVGSYSGEYVYYPWGNCYYNNNVCTSGAPSATTNDTFMVAVDMDAGRIWFGKNGTWLASGNPAAGTGAQYSGITGEKAFALSAYAGATPVQANFGQSGRMGTLYYGAAGGYFAYAPPSGFLALPSQSEQDISLVFKPDLVWVKNRTSAQPNIVVDSVRGVEKNLFTNLSNAQISNDTLGTVMSLNSPGFTVGASCAATTGTGNVNALNNSYVAWVWDKSATAGVDVITYSGNNASSQNVAHTLGTAPSAVFVKRTDAASDWFGWNTVFGGGTYLKLNTADPSSNATSPFAADLIPTMTAATTGGVTMSGSTEYQAAWRAGDKSFGSYWSTYANYPNSGTPQWLRVEFGSGNTRLVGSYTISTYNSAVNYVPQNFTFQGSNDATTCTASGAAWTTLDTQTGATWIGRPAKQTFTVPVANQAAYRCYRVYVTATNDAREVIISELNLWGGQGQTSSSFSVTSQNGAGDLNAMPYGANLIPTMTAATTGGVTMSGSTVYQPAWYAGDKSNSSYWSTYANYPNSGSPQWLRTDFGASTNTLAAYSVRAYSSLITSYAPIDFTFQGSNDATTCTASGAAWTTLDTRVGVTWVNAGENKTFLIPSANQAAYRCYRVYVTRNSGSEVIIAEFGVYASTGGSSQYVAYLFSDREGFQKSGAYFGNGSLDGPVLYTGFRPRYVMIKAGDRAADWRIYDTVRDDQYLVASTTYASSAAAESREAGGLQMLANGFKVRWSNAAVNANQERYEYIAFAQAPYKTSYDGSSGYNIANSLRFDANIGSYLSRTVTTIGDRKTHTFSAWVKRSALGTGQNFFTGNTGGTDNTYLSYSFNASDQIVIAGWNTVWRQTNESFSDTTQWYHIVVAIDTTNDNPDARVRLWVNGREITTFWCVDHVCYSDPS